MRDFTSILFVESESFLTDEMRAEQAAACTKERDTTGGARGGAAVLPVPTGGGAGSSSIPEVWDLWSLEREVTEDDSALRSTGTAWVSECERSWDERELLVEVEPLRGGPGEGEGEREWWVEVERGPWCGFVLGSARAFILLMDWGDVAPAM